MRLRAPHSQAGFVRMGATKYLHMRGKITGNHINHSPRGNSRDPGLQCDVAVNAVMSTAIIYNIVRMYSTVSLPNMSPVGQTIAHLLNKIWLVISDENPDSGTTVTQWGKRAQIGGKL